MRTLLALAASTLAVLAFSPVASAARYDVQLCTGAQQVQVATDLGALGFAIDNQCAGSVPHITQRKIVGSAQLVGGNTWTLTAPANTSIHTLDLDRAFLGTFDAGMEWRVTRPDDTFLEIANNQGHIAAGGIRYTVDALSLTAHFFCQATVTCVANNTLQVTVSNLVAAMDDSIPPTMSALSGPLVAGGPLRGTQAVTFSAHDSGAGIATVSLVVDGATATIVPQQNGGACVRPYKLLVPCALDLGTVVIPLDTTTLPDGAHTIQVGVADAAGNTKLSDPVAVTVRNAPVNTAVPLIKGVAKVGAQLAASTGAWDGSPSAFSFSYQWLGCPTAVTVATAIAPCTPIDGATDSTYVVTDTDVNRRLVVRVTATNAAGSGAAFSAPTDPVAPGSGDGGSGGGDRTAPVLSAVSLSRTRLRAIARAADLRLTSSEAGRLSIVIERARPGREVRQGGKLVCKAVRRAVRRGACTVYARTTTLTRSIRAGRTSVPLSAEHMAPGSYRITITVRDAAGNVSKAARRAFRIIRG